MSQNKNGYKQVFFKGTLVCANLERAKLEGADLTSGNLAFALLKGARLKGAIVKNAYLAGVKIGAVNLKRLKLGDADYNSFAKVHSLKNKVTILGISNSLMPDSVYLSVNRSLIFNTLKDSFGDSNQEVGDLDYTKYFFAPPDLHTVSSEKESKDVNISIYAPPRIGLGDSLMIQVWLYLPLLKKEIDKKAKEYDEDSNERGGKRLSAPIEQGTEVSLMLSCKELGYSKCKALVWDGPIDNTQFLVDIPETLKKKNIFFKIEVYLEKMIIGDIIFKIKAEKEMSANIDPVLLEGKINRLQKAFISYASKDRLKVLERVQGIAATKVYDIFQDIMNLSPGERWEKRLYKEIDKCDVFFLFWSKAAKSSKWVKKELLYAIDQKKGKDEKPPLIQPVIIPPQVNPPKEIGHLHFNDPIVQFIIAEQQRNKS